MVVVVETGGGPSWPAETVSLGSRGQPPGPQAENGLQAASGTFRGSNRG